jgi:hypothetical protein
LIATAAACSRRFRRYFLQHIFSANTPGAGKPVNSFASEFMNILERHILK